MTDKDAKTETNLSHHLTQLLLAMGFQVGNLGFNYLKRSITLMMDGSFCTLGEIYSVIANAEGKQPDSISSAIRCSIKSAYRQTGFKLLEELLSVKLFMSEYTVPSPREAIGLIKEYLGVIWDGESAIRTCATH